MAPSPPARCYNNANETSVPTCWGNSGIAPRVARRTQVTEDLVNTTGDQISHHLLILFGSTNIFRAPFLCQAVCWALASQREKTHDLPMKDSLCRHNHEASRQLKKNVIQVLTKSAPERLYNDSYVCSMLHTLKSLSKLMSQFIQVTFTRKSLFLPLSSYLLVDQKQYYPPSSHPFFRLGSTGYWLLPQTISPHSQRLTICQEWRF